MLETLSSGTLLLLCRGAGERYLETSWQQKVLFLFVLFTFYKFIYFIYLFLAVLGLHCCVQAFFSCGEQGLLFVVVRRLLIVVASLVTEHRL